jgi:methylthioribulose-1-phosphate dehydratase
MDPSGRCSALRPMEMWQRVNAHLGALQGHRFPPPMPSAVVPLTTDARSDGCVASAGRLRAHVPAAISPSDAAPCSGRNLATTRSKPAEPSLPATSLRSEPALNVVKGWQRAYPYTMTLADIAPQLAEIGREFHGRGWVLGTSGNFSAVVTRNPLRLAITSSGVDKGSLSSSQIVEIDEVGQVVAGSGRPSAESALHLAITRGRRAGAVLHTHSIWSTILSDGVTGNGLALEGYEMLKGLEGVTTHEHREWLPILDNTQDWSAAVLEVEALLGEHPDAHGFLIRRHGLYTWGRDLDQAKRQVEILEFLFEVMGRKRGMTWQP